jgi:hypothetical protein
VIQLATANNPVVTASDVDMGRSDIRLADSLTRPSIGGTISDVWTLVGELGSRSNHVEDRSFLNTRCIKNSASGCGRSEVVVLESSTVARHSKNQPYATWVAPLKRRQCGQNKCQMYMSFRKILALGP